MKFRNPVVLGVGLVYQVLYLRSNIIKSNILISPILLLILSISSYQVFKLITHILYKGISISDT